NGLVGRARHDYAERLDLVDGSVGGVAATAKGVEQNVATKLAAESRFKRGLRRCGHSSWVGEAGSLTPGGIVCGPKTIFARIRRQESRRVARRATPKLAQVVAERRRE